MKYKQVLIVRELGDNFQTNITQTSENQITTWCCVDQGSSKIQVLFEKNVFTPHELCKAYVDLDNSKCGVDLTNVRLAVEQELTLHGDSHRFY